MSEKGTKLHKCRGMSPLHCPLSVCVVHMRLLSVLHVSVAVYL